MLDHVGLNVSDYARSREFFARALAPLGLAPLMEPIARTGGSVSMASRGSGSPISASRSPRTFTSPSRRRTGRPWTPFHAAAVAAGGADNGPPGLRTLYHPAYYGAYVLDPDGNNIEAVCHRPVSS